MKPAPIVAALILTVGQAMAQSPFSQGTNNLARTNLANAYANFAAAVAANPADPAANVYYAMTRLLVLPSLPAGSNFLNSAGFQKAGRNVYDWKSKPANANGKFAIVPGENAAELTAQLRTNVLAAIIAAQTNLAQITDASFTLAMPGSVTHFSDVTIDYGDVLMLRAMLEATEVWIYQLNSLNLDAPITTVSNIIRNNEGIEGILASFPKAFTFATTSDMSVAQSTFSGAASLYFAASAFIRGRPADETRLFNLGPDQAKSEADFRHALTNLVISLNGGAQPISTNSAVRASAAAFFSGKTSLRALLPQFQNSDFVWNSFPDVTLGGLVSGVTETNLDKFLLKKANALLDAPNTSFAVLASFNSSDSPSGVILAKDGNLYGTTEYGGDNYNPYGYGADGTVFKVSPAGTIRIIYEFGTIQDQSQNALDGSTPNTLIQASDGNLYGTTQGGGANAYGTVFRITTAGKLTTLYSFGSGNDGDTPMAALVQGADGYLYGTTSDYSSGNYGTIFRISMSGQFQTLYSFSGGNDGSNPAAPLVEAGGNFYGTSQYGGANYFGSIFEVTPTGNLTPLYSFGNVQDSFGDSLDGAYPNGLALASDGFLYGTTTDGGSNDVLSGGDGTAFRISQSGVVQPLASFDRMGLAPYHPVGSLVPGAHGLLYGTTSGGGANQKGSIFALSPNGAISSEFWFTHDSGSGISYNGSGPTLGSDGNFYSVTENGGPSKGGEGTVYRFGVTQGPSIVSEPQSLTVAIGKTAVLQVTASGPPPLSYQWKFNSASLANGTHVSGATTSTLTLTGITQAAAGSYDVIVSDSMGKATSAVATITVIAPPVIAKQPAAQLNKHPGSSAEFTVAATGPAPLIYQWNLNGTPLSDTGNLFGTASSSLNIALASAADAGSYTVSVNNSFGSVTSSIALLTLARETTKPAVTISTPTAGARTTAPVLAGTASDAVRVFAVNYWITNVNNGVVTVASNQAALAGGHSVSNWSVAAMPLPGSNTLSAQSINYSGLTSPLATRSFFFEAGSPLQLIVYPGGAGTISGAAAIKGGAAPTNGASLYVGEGYSVTAHPASGWTFTEWTKNGVVATTNPILNFIMESNLAVHANFASNLMARMAGRYDGVFYSSNGPVVQTAGLIGNLQLGTDGTYSGKLYLGGSSYSFASQFNPDGQATNVVARAAAQGGPVTLNMSLADARPARLIKGAVRGGNPAAWSSDFLLFAAARDGHASSANSLLFQPDPALSLSEPGYGYALFDRGQNSLNITGFLADGTAFSQSGPIAENNEFPLYSRLYNGGGLILGRLSLSQGAAPVTSGGNVWWIKPASAVADGFSIPIFVRGTPWTNSLPAIPLPLR